MVRESQNDGCRRTGSAPDNSGAATADQHDIARSDHHGDVCECDLLPFGRAGVEDQHHGPVRTRPSAGSDPQIEDTAAIAVGFGRGITSCTQQPRPRRQPAAERHGCLPRQPSDMTPGAQAQHVSLGDRVVSAIVPARRLPPRPIPGLPVARLSIRERHELVHYVLTTMDDRGRLASRSLMRVLHWEPGQPITVTVAPSVVLVEPQLDGPEAITQHGHLRLPADVRYALGLTPGDRLLLAAFPDRSILAAYTMAALDSMVLAYHPPLTDRAQP